MFRKGRKLIFFCGNPYLGQEFIYRRNFSSYKRISFSQMISTGLTSRDCLKHLFALLKKENVVFDDPCSIFTSKDRKTLFHKIKQKFPRVKVIVYRFTGNIKERQNFFLQYRFAEHFPNDFFTYDPSFEKVEPVKRDEGYDVIKFENNLPLICDRRDYEMNHHALILDIDTISKYIFSSEETSRNNMKKFINLWLNSRTNVHDGVSVGRVIFLKIYPSRSSEKWRSSEDVDLKLIRFITSLRLTHPIYYIPIRKNCQTRRNNDEEEDEDEDDDEDEEELSQDDYFTKSPNFGLLPFLHYLFSLNLEKSVFVHRFLLSSSSEIHPLVTHFLNCGVKLVKTEEAIHSLISGKMTSQSSFDIFLHRNVFNDVLAPPPQIFPFFKVMKFDSSLKNPISPNPKIYPLLSSMTSESNHNNHHESYSVYHNTKGHQIYVVWDRVQNDISDLLDNTRRSNIQSNDFEDHYVFYSGLQISKHFPVSLNFTSNEEEEEEKEEDNEDGILLGNLGEMINNSNNNNNQNENKVQEQQDFVMNELFSMYNTSLRSDNNQEEEEEESVPNVLSLEYIVEYFGIVYFQRGRDYFLTGKISDLRTENSDDDDNNNTSTITSKCKGSEEGVHYDQETIIQHGKILSTNCSCPVSENCKHCCAQLLQNFTKDRDMESNSRPIRFLDLDPLKQSRNWCIKGIVVKKYGIRDYFNPQTTSGRVSSIVLKDQLEEEGVSHDEQRIRVVMFNETLDKFHHKFRVGCLYLVSRGHLRPVNENYASNNTTSNKYDVMLHSESEVKQLTFLNWKTEDYEKFSRMLMSPAQFMKKEFQKRMSRSNHVEFVEDEEVDDDQTLMKPSKRKRSLENENDHFVLPELKRRKRDGNEEKGEKEHQKEEEDKESKVIIIEEEEDDDDDDLFAEVE